MVLRGVGIAVSHIKKLSRIKMHACMHTHTDSASEAQVFQNKYLHLLSLKST